MSTFIDATNIKEFIKLNKQALYRNGKITLSHGVAYNNLLSSMARQQVCHCVSNKTAIMIVKSSIHNLTFTIYLESSIPDLKDTVTDL